MTTQMLPFWALYGYDPPISMDLLWGDSRVLSARDMLQDNQDVVRSLRDNIQMAQNQQKQYAY